MILDANRNNMLGQAAKSKHAQATSVPRCMDLESLSKPSLERQQAYYLITLSVPPISIWIGAHVLPRGGFWIEDNLWVRHISQDLRYLLGCPQSRYRMKTAHI